MRILELFHGGFPVTQVAFKVNELEHAVVCAAVSGWIAFALGFAIFAVLLAGTISEAVIEDRSACPIGWSGGHLRIQDQPRYIRKRAAIHSGHRCESWRARLS